ncbi:cephalosporin hydroxylase family protein [Chloroflexota bacterium]
MANNYKRVNSLREYVLTKDDKNIQQLEKVGFEWLVASVQNRLSYEIDWLGMPIIQTPEDLILLQELIFNVRPDVVIETGIAHGGGLIYYASLLELLNRGKVIGVDIEIRKHNRKAIEAHPMFKRIEMIEGDSVATQTVQEIKKRVPKGSQVIVCLDSGHTKDHVLRELELYQDFIAPGGYFIVFDTVSSELAKLGVLEKEFDKYIDNGPKEAVDEFLKMNDSFKINKKFNRLYVTHTKDGYLKRIK